MSAPHTPLSAVDVIVESEGKIVLIRRGSEPYRDKLALPGGFQEIGESLEEAAVREMREELGLEIDIENPGRPYSFSSPGRDPRGPVNSHLYFAKGRGNLIAGDDAAWAGLYSLGELRSMLGTDRFAFDHEEMIRVYLRWKGELE